LFRGAQGRCQATVAATDVYDETPRYAGLPQNRPSNIISRCRTGHPWQRQRQAHQDHDQDNVDASGWVERFHFRLSDDRLLVAMLEANFDAGENHYARYVEAEIWYASSLNGESMPVQSRKCKCEDRSYEQENETSASRSGQSPAQREFISKVREDVDYGVLSFCIFLWPME
jgi:hypothetical protein